MPPAIISGEWKLVTKRTIGDKGYTFRSLSPVVTFAAGSGCEKETKIIPAHITLVVNVVERLAQRIYFELDESFDPKACKAGESAAWKAYALITPVENEDLDDETADWKPDVEFKKPFALDFRVVCADCRAGSVYGKLPHLKPH